MREHLLREELEDASAKRSSALRVLLAQLRLELPQLQLRIDEADAVIKKTAGDGLPSGPAWNYLLCSLPRDSLSASSDKE